MANIKAPFGDADVKTLTATGAQAITVTNPVTVIDGVTTKSTDDRTLNLTIDSELPIGAMLFVATKDTNGKKLIFGTGITMEDYTATTADDIASIAFFYDGDTFYPMGDVALASDES